MKKSSREFFNSLELVGVPLGLTMPLSIAFRVRQHFVAELSEQDFAPRFARIEEDVTVLAGSLHKVNVLRAVLLNDLLRGHSVSE